MSLFSLVSSVNLLDNMIYSNMAPNVSTSPPVLTEEAAGELKHQIKHTTLLNKWNQWATFCFIPTLPGISDEHNCWDTVFPAVTLKCLLATVVIVPELPYPKQKGETPSCFCISTSYD